jgi:hypothetical protein
MAAFAPAHSAEWTAFTATPAVLPVKNRWGARLRCSTASLTLTGAGVATAAMLRLPPGQVRVYTNASRIRVPDGATGAVADVGFLAYVNEAGTTVNANSAAFHLNGACGSGDLDANLALPAVGYLDLNSQIGIDLTVKISVANSPSSGEIWLCVVYSQ